MVGCFVAFTSVTFAQVPVITSFSPTSGPLGTAVTINGTGFSTTPANNRVYFGATKATVTAATATQLTVQAPADGSYKPISVNVNGLTGYSRVPFIVTFTSGVQNGDQFAYGAGVNFQAGQSPYAVAVGDFDSDGKTDIAVSDIQIPKLTVFKNIGPVGYISAASLSPGVDLTGGTYTDQIAVGDLNGDGFQDIALTGNQTTNVSIYQNKDTPGSITTATFAAPVNYPQNPQAAGVWEADFDGDGKPDVLTSINSEVYVMQNTTAANVVALAAPVDLGFQGIFAIADFDGDNRPDIVAYNSGTTISVYRNTMTSAGTITASSFAPAVNFNVSGNGIALTVADIDVDGKPDIIFLDGNLSIFSIFQNIISSPGIDVESFQPRVDFNAGSSAELIRVGEMNGDGKPDIFIGSEYSLLFANISSVGSIGTTSIDYPQEYYFSSKDVTIADADGDGKNDIITVDGDKLLIVYPNELGIPTNIPVITSFSPTSAINGATVTITGKNFSLASSDNIVFFGATQATVTSASATQLKVTVPAGATSQAISETTRGLTAYSSLAFVPTFSGNGTIDATTFVDKDDLPVDNYTADLFIIDMDHDGLPDVVTQEGDPFGIFQNTTTPVTNISFAEEYTFSYSQYNLAIVDADGDGKPDVASEGEPDDYGLSFFYNDGVIGDMDQDEEGFEFTGSVYTENMASADLDGDGRPDLVYGNGWDNTIDIFRNDNGGYSQNDKTVLDADDYPNFVALTDMDGNGLPDLLVAYGELGYISVSRNISTPGNIMFDVPNALPTDSEPFMIATGDLDGDGKMDIISVNDQSVSILRNKSTAGTISTSTFDTHVDLTNPNSPNFAAVGDLNGDGKIDLAVGNYDGQSISVYKNLSTSGSLSVDSFGPAVNYDAPGFVDAIAIGDLNNDGKADIAVTTEFYIGSGSAENYTLSVYLNQSTVTAAHPPVIADTTDQVQKSGIVVIDLVPLLSDPDNNLDLKSLQITAGPTSNAPASISAAGKLTIDYTDNSFTGTDAITIQVCDLTGLCTSHVFNIVVGGEPGALIVYNGVSPDNNSQNDTWIILNIASNPDTKTNHVTLYNRWGDSVYEADNYDNVSTVFTGRNNSGTDLPSGIYFYKISFTGGRKTLTGYLSLKR